MGLHEASRGFPGDLRGFADFQVSHNGFQAVSNTFQGLDLRTFSKRLKTPWGASGVFLSGFGAAARHFREFSEAEEESQERFRWTSRGFKTFHIDSLGILEGFKELHEILGGNREILEEFERTLEACWSFSGREF